LGAFAANQSSARYLVSLNQIRSIDVAVRPIHGEDEQKMKARRILTEFSDAACK
jgi:hypothetical protein